MFTIEGELTIHRAAEIFPQLLSALAVCGQPATLGLAGVTEIDTSGVQLLLTAQRVAQDSGRALVLDAPSASVREALSLLGLEASFSLAACRTRTRRQS